MDTPSVRLISRYLSTTACCQLSGTFAHTTCCQQYPLQNRATLTVCACYLAVYLYVLVTFLTVYADSMRSLPHTACSMRSLPHTACCQCQHALDT